MSTHNPEGSDTLLGQAGGLGHAQAGVDPVGLAVEPRRPDITPAQIVGLIPVAAALLRAFGVYDLNPEQQNALEDAVTAGIVLIGADTLLRGFRNFANR